MRRFAPLILIGFVAIVAGVGWTYYQRLKLELANSPAKPKKIASGLSASFHGWNYSHTSSQKTVITMHADDFQELNAKDELSGLTLDIYNKDGKNYDHVTSSKAEFDPATGILYSDGEVQITLNVPVGEKPSGRLMSITSSGVHVESKTGKANTDRLATFKFDRGDGHAMGADYDPTTRELNLHSQVSMTWRGTDPHTVPMKIETDQLNYNEKEAKVFLSPWSRLKRDTLLLNAGPAIVTLDHGNLERVETTKAKGSERRPGRNLDFSANQLIVEFNDNNQVQKITGVDQARVVSTGETSVTTLSSDSVVMAFDTTTDDSILKVAVSQGHSVMRSQPVVKPGADPADTRVLKSDTIYTNMRPGGQEIDSVETGGAGAIEFIPNAAGKPHRWMNGGKIRMVYGPRNALQTFESVNVTTRTEKPKPKGAKAAPPPDLTWSKNLLAKFLPNSSQLASLDQSGDFRYQAGDRRATAERALLDQPKNVITLLGNAHIRDATGSADADKIVLNQMTGDFTAEGHVTSTRMPDKQKPNAQGGGMLDQSEPLYARADKMVSQDGHKVIRYQGDAVLWQGADRLTADSVEIDRNKDLLKAHGHVVSQLLDKGKNDASSQAGAAKAKTASNTATKGSERVFTIVRAPDLEYNDNTRLAHYSGGAVLERPDMTVKGQDIRAYLRNNSNDSSLDHATADGKVEIHEVSPDRVRDAWSEHAEYYVDQDKVILEGGKPRYVDSLRGSTQGAKLIWYSNDDRLNVDGVPQQPVQSLLHKKTVKAE